MTNLKELLNDLGKHEFWGLTEAESKGKDIALATIAKKLDQYQADPNLKELLAEAQAILPAVYRVNRHSTVYATGEEFDLYSATAKGYDLFNGDSPAELLNSIREGN